jgi:hypothetical protein
MNWKERFAFLDAKRKLMAPFLRYDSAATQEMLFTHVAAHTPTAKRPRSTEALNGMDQSLERTIAEEILEDDERAIRDELKTRFGFSCFGEEPLKVLRRIKRTGKIRSEAEAALVDQYLSGDFLGGFMSDADQKRFNDIARSYYDRTDR